MWVTPYSAIIRQICGAACFVRLFSRADRPAIETFGRVPGGINFWIASSVRRVRGLDFRTEEHAFRRLLSCSDADLSAFRQEQKTITIFRGIPDYL